MKKNIAKILFLAMILVGLGLFQKTGAIGGDFDIVLIPKYPQPGIEAVAKIQSYNFDPSRSVVIWQIDGKAAAKGFGERTIKFTMPDLGKELLITANVITEADVQSSKTLFLSGNDVDFLWEALTYTPLGYKGKALPVVESFVRVTAIPHIFENKKETPTQNLVYEWSVNFKKDIPASGGGKNSFTFKLKDFDDHTVTLRVSNRTESVVFEKGFVIETDVIEPKILFYENNPLEGPRYNKALAGEIVLSNGEIGIRAEPFFFSRGALARLSYEWAMNAEKIFPEQFANVLSLRAGPANGGGRSVIDLRISNPVNLLQTAKERVEIQY